MYLITGGLGKVGTIVRSGVNQLTEADVFDIGQGPSHDLLNPINLATAVRARPYTTVIHLAEQGKMSDTTPEQRNTQSFNQKVMFNLTSELRNTAIKLIYTTEMNTARGGYNRSKTVNSNRVLNMGEFGYVLPLGEILKTTNDLSAIDPSTLFGEVLKSAMETRVINLAFAADEVVYFATEEMVVSAFSDLLTNIETTPAGVIENQHYIAIKVGTLAEMLKARFENLAVNITGRHPREQQLGEEKNVELFQQYLQAFTMATP